MSDEECICRGNWRRIVKEVDHLIGSRFRDSEKEYIFRGVVHSDDDYYYLMWRKDEMRLLSCVGSLDQHGFYLIND